MGNGQLQKENVETDFCVNGRVESAELETANGVCSSDSESTNGLMHSDNFSRSPDIQPQTMRLSYEDMGGDTLELPTSNGVTRRSAFGVTAQAVRDTVSDVGTSRSVPTDI